MERQFQDRNGREERGVVRRNRLATLGPELQGII
jgi:hypothetical protein